MFIIIRLFLAIGLWFLLVLLSSDANWLERASLIGITLVLTYLVERQIWFFVGLLFGLILSTVLYFTLELRYLASLIVITYFSFLIILKRQLTIQLFGNFMMTWLWRFSLWPIFALGTGFGLAVINMVDLNFSEEEFFSVVNGIYLSFFWLVVAASYQLIHPESNAILQTIQQAKLYIGLGVTVCCVGVIALMPALAKHYQRSFFPEIAPNYPTLSEKTPFLCETIKSEESIVSAETIRADFIKAIEAMPEKDTRMWGVLAVYTANPSYAETFRAQLLQEAQAGVFTEPAHSIKWGQLLAAQRAHLFTQLQQKYPHLFSPDDQQVLKNWFATINQRALTVEWVDYLYAIAYNTKPQGPYENQEIGAGLLAVLENTGLANPNLTTMNRDYLKTTPLGWQHLARNTDDSYWYQGIWQTNAWWLYQYQKSRGLVDAKTEHNRWLSYQWLLAMALPDGEALSYNIHGSPDVVTYYLMGAVMFDDPALSWLAGQQLKQINRENKPIYMLPLVPLDKLVDGLTPSIGSCLIFGNSGVPTTKGVLAPDKVILRDGWGDNATYLMLNLRFTGWHRYKATGTVTTLYQQGPLVSEKWTSEKFWWLPAGRSAFRDKRVPRENLNGLLLPKSGLSKVIWLITGLGGPWMQNPPAYAEIEKFFSSELVDAVKINIPTWNGWQHERSVYLIKGGMVIIIDEATTETAPGPASLTWYLNGDGELTKNGLRLTNRARFVWSGNHYQLTPELPTEENLLQSPNWQIQYTSPNEKRLFLISAFLMNEYTQGEISFSDNDDEENFEVIWRDGEEVVSLTGKAGKVQFIYGDDVIGFFE